MKKDLTQVQWNIVLIGIASVVSLSFGVFHIIMSFLLEKEGLVYTPLVIENASPMMWDEGLFAARMTRAYSGYLFKGDFYAMSPFPHLPPAIFSYFLHWFDSINTLFVVADFIFPTCVFFLVYFFLLKITERKLWSVAGSLCVLYGAHFLYSFPPITNARLKQTLKYLVNYGDGISPLEFSRFFDPSFTFPLLILAILSLFRALQNQSIRYGLFSGLCLGALFYSYFYYWTFFMAGCFFLLTCFLINRCWSKVKLTTIPLTVGCLIGIGVLKNFIGMNQNLNSDFLIRNGLEYSRAFNIPKFYLLFASLFTIFYRQRDTKVFLICFFLGGLLLMNAQVITGYTVLVNHWNARILQYWVVIMMFTWGLGFFRRSKWVYRLICTTMIIFFISYGFYTHSRFAIRKYHDFHLPMEIQTAFDWVKKNTLPGNIAMSCSIRMNFLLPIYTYSVGFLPNAGGETMVSDKELLERLFTTFKIFDVPENYFEDFFAPPPNTNKKEDILRENSGLSYLFQWAAFRYASIQRKQQIIQDFRNWDLAQGLHKYPVDYIITGFYDENIKGKYALQKELPSLKLEMVYQNSRVTIYKIKHSFMQSSIPARVL